MSPFLLLAALLLLGVLLYRHALSRPPNFPPGPPRLPVWGSYWLLLLANFKFLHLGLLRIAKIYKTNVLGFYLGPFPCVVTCDHDSVNELLRRPEFQGRPDILVNRVRARGGRYGILFVDGQDWVEQRRFFLRQMRDIGFGRRLQSIETVMEEEVRDIVDLMKGDWKDELLCRGGEVLFSRLFVPPSLNAMWSMFGGKRFPRGKYEPLHVLGEAASDFMQNAESSGLAVSMTPWLQHLSPGGFGVKKITDITQKIFDFIRIHVFEHKAEFTEGHLTNFIDIYLNRIKNDPDYNKEVFNDSQLAIVALDMIIATSTALVGSLAFFFQCLLHYPEVQKKIQAEMDQVVGRDRIATLDDRQRMPYLEAALRESMRRITSLPLSVPHLATEDTYFQGYFIPKNTVMFPHVFAAHMDPKVFKDPESFRPERFLDENGMLLKKDLTTPFGVGKRLCVGETFSRHFMFLLIAGILQNFNFEPADPANLPAIDAVQPGFSTTPLDIWAKIIPRN